jgi:hypothetical protein
LNYAAYCYAKEYDAFKDGITCGQYFLKEEPQIKKYGLNSKEIEIYILRDLKNNYFEYKSIKSKKSL